MHSADYKVTNNQLAVAMENYISDSLFENVVLRPRSVMIYSRSTRKIIN